MIVCGDFNFDLRDGAEQMAAAMAAAKAAGDKDCLSLSKGSQGHPQAQPLLERTHRGLCTVAIWA